MSDAITLQGVTKTFGAKTAVEALDLVVPRGGLYGFIGPNGAGKTTTIRMIMAMLFPDSGTISVLGHGSALDAKDRIGYLPEERGVYKKMRVGSFLAYMAQLKGYSGSGIRRQVRVWLERVGLGETERKRCEELSKGMQQKVQFLATVIHEPDLLILDEPFSGLDPVNMRLLRELVLEQHRRGATVIFSTHVMVQAEQICEHVVMINNGIKVLDDTVAAIRAAHDPRSILFEPRDADAEVSSLASLAEVAHVCKRGGTHELIVRDGVDPSAAMAAIITAIPAARIELNRPSLEDVFVSIVSGASDADDEVARLRDSVRAHAGTGLAS